MAELIRKEDTLNEGRIKLNNAISDAEQAKNTAGQADSKATQALANSESTQTQLDTIVIEGDSSVEAAQARVDETGGSHPTLKARIDEGFTEVKSQLAVTVEDLRRRGADPVSFGADPTGNVDSTQSILNAFVLNKHLVLPPGVFLISNLDVPDGCTIHGSGKTLTVLKKCSDGYMIDLGRQSMIFDCGFNGLKSQYKGPGVVVSKGENTTNRIMQGHQRIVRCAFDEMDSYHIEYTQPNRGWMSRAIECDFGITNADASVKWPDETTNGGNRSIIDSYSAKPIVNVGGCDNGIISFNTVGGTGADEEGIIFPSGTMNPAKKIIVSGNRFAVANGNIRVRGLDHSFSDNICAANFYFEQDATGCSFSETNKLTGTFTNKHVSNKVYGVSGTFTPEWTSSGATPSYGNAQVVGYWKWEGNYISVSVQITFGSSTNFGTGTWMFGMPVVLQGMPKTRFTGSVWGTHGNGVVYGLPENGYMSIYRNDVVGTFNYNSPSSWATGDVLVFEYSYPLRVA